MEEKFYEKAHYIYTSRGCDDNYDTPGNCNHTVSAVDSASGDGWSFDSTTGTLTVNSNVGMTSDGKGTSFNYSDVKIVVIHDGVTSIKSGAFEGCTGLTTIEIPNSVTSIAINNTKLK